MQPKYELEFTKRATEEGWWVTKEGSGPEWEAAREAYVMTASAMGALWNGAGYERTKRALDRIVDGERRVFDAYTLRLLEEGKRMEKEVLVTLLQNFWGLGTWKLSPGVFEVRLASTRVGASPDAVLWLERHQIPVEVKWHANGECKMPMPVGYFAQLYTQMMATRATLGLYLGMAPNGEMWGSVVGRSREVDMAFHERMGWFEVQIELRRKANEENREREKRGEKKKKKCYPSEVDALEELRNKCVIWKQANLTGLRDFLVARTKFDDVRGNTDYFDLERNAVPPTAPVSPSSRPASPCALPLPGRKPACARVARHRSRSSSPRARSVPEGIVCADVAQGDETLEGTQE